MFKKKTRFGETNCLLDLVFRNWEEGIFWELHLPSVYRRGKDSKAMSTQDPDYRQLSLRNPNFSFYFHFWIVIVESSLIFIRGCNSVKLCLYFPETAPGTRNKISRKRDLWSPNMTHSDLNLLAWCCKPEHKQPVLEKPRQNTHSSIELISQCDYTILVTMVKMNRLRPRYWVIVCVPGMYPLWHLRVPRYYCARGPAVPWQLCLAAWPQSLFTAFRLFICFDLICPSPIP